MWQPEQRIAETVAHIMSPCYRIWKSTSEVNLCHSKCLSYPLCQSFCWA